MIRTKGISRKLLAGVQAALTACLTTWIVTGSFDRTQLALLAVAGIALFFGWLLPPDENEVVDPPNLGGADVPSDALLAAQIDDRES